MNEKKENLPVAGDLSPFERIRRTNAAGAAYWSSRDFAVVLGYTKRIVLFSPKYGHCETQVSSKDRYLVFSVP